MERNNDMIAKLIERVLISRNKEGCKSRVRYIKKANRYAKERGGKHPIKI